MSGLPVTDRARRQVAALLVAVAMVTIAYWVVWFTDRSVLASETTSAYYDFENAFPLADGWWVLGLVGSAWALLTRRPLTFGALLVAGGAGLYLFCMDVLYDAEHRIWAKGGGGAVEGLINAATLAVNVGILRWAWRRRAALAEGETSETGARRELRRSHR
jgi:hypothetical protein